MRTRPVQLILLALALVLAGVFASSPAIADHSGQAVCTDTGRKECAHWGNRYSPPLYVNVPGVPANYAHDVVQDAAYFWQDNGFVQGWNPGAFVVYSNRSCNNFVDGAVFVCFVGTGDPNLHGNQGYTALTRFGRCDTACNHIYAAVVYIDAGLSPATRQIIMRHEMGHAMGLGHTTNGFTVMNNPTNTPYANQHERDAMWAMYSSHISG